MLGICLKTTNKMVQYLIIRYGSNHRADIIENIYVACNMACILYSCKLIVVIAQEISRPEVIPGLVLQDRLLHCIEVNTRSAKSQGCYVLYQSEIKKNLLAGISQASQCEVIVHAVDPSLNNLIVHLPFLHRWRLQFNGIQDNVGKQSSSKRCRASHRLQITKHSYYGEYIRQKHMQKTTKQS